jgi:cytochrome P450
MRQIADLPGPSGLPLLGNLLQVDRDRIHRDVERWAREHGPLFRFSFGRQRILGVADHELLNALLRDRPDGFRRTRHMELISREMGLTPGLFGSNGDAWRRQRRMVMAGLDPNHVREYFPSLLKVTQRLHGRWQRAAHAGAAIELQPDLMRFTVDAIAGLAFGADINTLESDADIIQRHLDKIFPSLFKRMFSLVPVWRWRRSKADRELEQSVAAVNAAISGFIAQARARLAADAQRRSAPPNLLESMIVAAESADSGLLGAISDTEVAGNVMTMLLAGEDTTANTLAWMIYLMHRHPDVLARARAEVLAVAGSVEQFDPQRMAGLDYLEACAHETMRLKPVAPFQVVEALRDTTVGGVQVPRGTIIWCAMRVDSISDAHFPDATAFKPERWLGDDAAASPMSSAKRVSMPFGAGPRVCPGRYLALLEIKMAMAMLLAHFEIDAVGTPDGAEPAEQMSFTMSPLGLSMRLSLRSH